MKAGPNALPRPDASFRGVLLLQGLPFQANPDQIASYFSDYKLQSPTGSVFIIAMTTGRPSGSGYVVFESEAEAFRAKTALVRVCDAVSCAACVVSHDARG